MARLGTMRFCHGIDFFNAHAFIARCNIAREIRINRGAGAK